MPGLERVLDLRNEKNCGKETIQVTSGKGCGGCDPLEDVYRLQCTEITSFHAI